MKEWREGDKLLAHDNRKECVALALPVFLELFHGRSTVTCNRGDISGRY